MLPIVDVSVHQGRIDFARMRAEGVAGVIIRLGHGKSIDERFAVNWNGALAAGYTRDDLAVYTFVNPKRGSAAECADAMLTRIDQVVGDTRVGYMLDVEHYAAQSPFPGAATLAGPAFADHIRAHRDHVLEQADGAFVFGYAARSFWNGPSHRPGIPWVGDAALAAELEWLVPRFPVWPPAKLVEAAANGNPGPLNAWIFKSPKPPAPDQWNAWSLQQQPAGPIPPIGGDVLGWQFSADYNRQGPRYGASSSDLDLNVIHADAWARWTARPITPPPTIPIPTTPEDDTMILIRNAETHTFTDGKVYPARNVMWELTNGELRHISATEAGAIIAAHGLDPADTSMPKGVPRAELTNAQLAALPRYTKPGAPGTLRMSGTFIGTAAP